MGNSNFKKRRIILEIVSERQIEKVDWSKVLCLLDRASS